MFFKNNTQELNKINVVSLQNTEKPQTLTTQVDSPSLKNLNESEPKQIQSQIIQSSYNKLLDLSYMELYNKSLLAQDCYSIYNEEDKINSDAGLSTNISLSAKVGSVDHLQKYRDNIQFNSNFRQQEPTTTQINYYKNFINECHSLKQEVMAFIEEEDSQVRALYLIKKNIRKSMDNTKPITDEEIELKRTLKVIQDFKVTSAELLKLKNENYTKSEEEVHKLESLIRGLYRELSGSKFFGEEAKKSIEYLNIQEQLNTAKETLDSSRILDKPKIALTKERVLNHLNELQLNLSSKYPTVFVETFQALNFASINTLPAEYKILQLHKTDKDIEILSQQIYDDMPLKNKKYFNTLLDPAINLYLCYLGDDCIDINNRTMKRLCFIPKILFNHDHAGIFYEACDSSLEDFYLHYYLTENQVEDMNVLFDYLVNNYAK